jgi:hypothetical protein
VLYLGEGDILYGEPDEGDINPDDNRDYFCGRVRARAVRCR